MLFLRRGWGIDVVSAEPDRATYQAHQSQKHSRKRGSTKGRSHGPLRKTTIRLKLSAFALEQHGWEIYVV
jgi:hypothetical protein